jgi:Ca2+-binding EF-hand superfamily protein
VREQDFKSALGALGIKLRPGEFNKVKEVLDPNNVMYFRYTSIVKELMGIPQRDFMHKAINKLAAVVEGRDLTEDQFRQLVEPKNGDQSMDEPTFKKVMDQCAGPDFQFDQKEIVGQGSLFNSLTGANERTTGVKMKVGDLVNAVFAAVEARLVDQVRVALNKEGLTVASVFSKYDKNKDGFLDYSPQHSELQKVLEDCHRPLKPNMLRVIQSRVLDPSKSHDVQRRDGTGKIGMGMMKFYFEQGASSTESMQKEESKVAEGEPSGLSQETLQISKRASRKILTQCHQTISTTLEKLDPLDEGILNREELKRVLEGLKINDLDRDELTALLKGCDRGQKGYIASAKFLEKLYSLAAETETETILRRLAKALQHSSTNLKQELERADTSGKGKLDQLTFKRTMKSLSIALSDQEIQKL